MNILFINSENQAKESSEEVDKGSMKPVETDCDGMFFFSLKQIVYFISKASDFTI